MGMPGMEERLDIIAPIRTSFCRSRRLCHCTDMLRAIAADIARPHFLPNALRARIFVQNISRHDHSVALLVCLQTCRSLRLTITHLHLLRCSIVLLIRSIPHSPPLPPLARSLPPFSPGSRHACQRRPSDVAYSPRG